MSLRTLGMSVAAVLALAGCGPGAPGGEDRSRLETPAVADAPEASPSSTAPLTGASAPDRFTAIGAGGTHTCAMDDSGRVWCWGWDESGQLGRGEPSDGPTVVVGEHEFTEIRAGDGFTCALDRIGKAWCWGLDHHGQLGDGDPVGGQADAPLLVAGARDFSSVAAGGGEGWGAGHACALNEDGRPWCWGSDDYGQIGDGARSNGDHAAPVLVAGERRFSAVSTNGEQSCALDRQHRAWCWGAYHYEIYDDWFDRSIGDVPQRVPGGHDFTQIATSGMGACALDSKGRAWCWGANRSGRLGDGEAVGSDEVGEFSDAPVAVGGGHRFVGISADKDLTCAIDADGRAWCWGAYWFDTYEPNPASSIGSTPVEVAGGHAFTAVSVGGRGACALDMEGRTWCWGKYAWPPDSEEEYDWDNYDWDTPTETAVGRTFSTITAGGDHTCGIDTSGSAWCWGSDSFGELGDGHRLRPVAGAQSFQKLGVGVDASCALDDQGSAWCWGRGGEVTDETGETTTATMATPQRVAGENRFASISAGGFQTCAIGEAGTTWCWTPGDDRPLDSPVPGGHEFATISVGAAQACAVDSGTRAWCWCTGEAGNLGLLGNGDTGECAASSPVPVSGDHAFVAVAAGEGHTCALDTKGAAWCWGDDSSGQIGDGDASTDTRFEPALVTGGHAFTALSVGRGHTCGLDSTGRAWCWGWDGWGQLGDGDTSQESRTSPALVAGGHTFTAISAGAYHTCALDRNGQPWCWGSDELGQLSDGDPFRVNKSAPVHVVTP